MTRPLLLLLPLTAGCGGSIGLLLCDDVRTPLGAQEVGPYGSTPQEVYDRGVTELDVVEVSWGPDVEPASATLQFVFGTMGEARVVEPDPHCSAVEAVPRVEVDVVATVTSGDGLLTAAVVGSLVAQDLVQGQLFSLLGGEAIVAGDYWTTTRAEGEIIDSVSLLTSVRGGSDWRPSVGVETSGEEPDLDAVFTKSTYRCSSAVEAGCLVLPHGPDLDSGS